VLRRARQGRIAARAVPAGGDSLETSEFDRIEVIVGSESCRPHNQGAASVHADRGRGIASARHVNDSLAETVAANPSRYGGLATLPMQDPAAATAELAA